MTPLERRVQRKLARFSASLSADERAELRLLVAAKDRANLPRIGQPGKDVMWLPTPLAIVDRMLTMARITPRDFLIDLGSGDGRIPITAVHRFEARAALGIEHDPCLVATARRNADYFSLGKKVRFRCEDLTASRLSGATVVTMFLTQRLNLKLRSKLLRLKPGTRLISHTHDMWNWEPDDVTHLVHNGLRTKIYLWRVPELSDSGPSVALRPKRATHVDPTRSSARVNVAGTPFVKREIAGAFR